MKPDGWRYGYSVDPPWVFMPYVFLLWNNKDSPGPFCDRSECFDMALKGLNEKIEEVCLRKDIEDKIINGLKTAQGLTLWLDESAFDEYTVVAGDVKDPTTYEYSVGKVRVELNHAYINGSWCSYCGYMSNTCGVLSPLATNDNVHENRNVSFSQAIDNVIPLMVSGILESSNSCISDVEREDTRRMLRELRALKKTLAAEQVALF